MERTTYLSLLFLLLVAAVEVWVFTTESNRRVKALKIHFIALQELITFLIVWYIWKRVTYLFKSGNAFSLSSVVRAAFALLLGFAQAGLVVAFVFVGQEPAYVTSISSTCLGVVIFIFTCLVIVDVPSYVVRTVFFRGSLEATTLVRTEIKWRTLLAFVGAVGLTFAGVIGMSRFTVERLTIPIQGLNPRLNGTTIVQLSDIHLGGVSGRSALQRIVGEVNQLEADIVVITGDLVDSGVESLRAAVEPVKNIKSKYGVFFATGKISAVLFHVILHICFILYTFYAPP